MSQSTTTPTTLQEQEREEVVKTVTARHARVLIRQARAVYLSTNGFGCMPVSKRAVLRQMRLYQMKSLRVMTCQYTDALAVVTW